MSDNKIIILAHDTARKLAAEYCMTATKGWVVRFEPPKRSDKQNRLQRKWLLEAAEQLKEYTPEEYRAYCKLHFGVPILRNENDKFRELYDRVVRPLSYEIKLEIMSIPIDFPVTRLMDKDQKKRCLDAIYQHFTGLGVFLTTA